MIWYDMIWYDMIWYDMIWYDMMSDVMWCDVMWCDVMWCDVMWCDVMWCDVMWCDMIWYDMIWYDMIWYDMIWYDMIWYDMIWYDMIWYDMIWYDMIWYDMIWYDMIWYDMIYIYIWYIFIYYIDIHIIYVIVIYRPFCWTFAADWICSVHSDPTELITGWARAPQAWEAQTSRWIAGEIRWNHGINGEWPLILSWWIFDWRIKLKPLQSTLIQLQNWDFGSLHIQSSTRNIRFCQHLQSKSYSPRALVSIPAWALGDVFFGLWCDSRTWLYDTNGSNQP